MKTLLVVNCVRVSVVLLSRERLQTLYGVSIADPNLVILMHHRAVLFGLLGVFFIVAAFVGGYNPRVSRVFRADMLALVCLEVGMGAHAMQRAV